jgi:hypothetical protein
MHWVVKCRVVNLETSIPLIWSIFPLISVMAILSFEFTISKAGSLRAENGR